MNLLKQILLMTLVATVVVVFSNVPIMKAALNNSPRVWAGAFESNPTGTDSISQGDDHIRQVKAEVRGRLQTEHTFGAIVDAADDGRHREGSGRAFFQGEAPVDIGEGEVVGGVNDYFNGVTGVSDSALDEGRLWHDSDVDNGTFKIHDGTSFIEAVTALSGDPNNRINLLSGAQFMLASDQANQINIHDHDARHLSSGLDRILNLINSFARGYNQLEINHVGILPITQISASIDFTGRGGLSHVLLFASINVRSAAGSLQPEFQIFDSVGGAIPGSNFILRATGFPDDINGAAMIIEQIAVTAAPHVWTLEMIATSVSNQTNHFNSNRLLFVIDLGRE